MIVVLSSSISSLADSFKATIARPPSSSELIQLLLTQSHHKTHQDIGLDILPIVERRKLGPKLARLS